MPSTIALIPGNMCDARLWDGESGLLRSDLAKYGCNVHDANTMQDDTIAGMAARILARCDGMVLPIGFSMGAIIALEMARQEPERITGAALFGLNAGPDLADRSAVRMRQQAEVRAGGLERVIVEELKPNYLALRNRGDKLLLTLLHDMGMALGLDVFIAQSEALRLRDDLRPVLDRLPVPVLLGCGQEDMLCPPSWHEQWAARLSDVRNLVFAGAGHMLPLEGITAFAREITRWIDEKGLMN